MDGTPSITGVFPERDSGIPDYSSLIDNNGYPRPWVADAESLDPPCPQPWFRGGGGRGEEQKRHKEIRKKAQNQNLIILLQEEQRKREQLKHRRRITDQTPRPKRP